MDGDAVESNKSHLWIESSFERGDPDSPFPSLALWALAETQPKHPGGERDSLILEMGEALQV